MTGRPLQNFDLYLDKLKAYARACEIKIVYRDEPSDGVYIPSQRKIVLDKDLPESTEIATLLHELGHSTDDTLYDPKAESRLAVLYRKVYVSALPKKHLAEIVECERRAWLYGRSIAKKLRIPLGLWFEREEDEALAGYVGLKTR